MPMQRASAAHENQESSAPGVTVCHGCGGHSQPWPCADHPPCMRKCTCTTTSLHSPVYSQAMGVVSSGVTSFVRSIQYCPSLSTKLKDGQTPRLFYGLGLRKEELACLWIRSPDSVLVKDRVPSMAVDKLGSTIGQRARLCISLRSVWARVPIWPAGVHCRFPSANSS